MSEKVKVSDLRLGDIVSTFDGPFNTAVVCKVEPDFVTLQRPYMRADGAAYGNHVACLTGIETFSVWEHNTVTLLQRGDVK